ncbi:MAG: D-hexose-6-phosphate mutarotase [Nitrosomonadales bacterium]|nr:D-hexose-6-phosphate mutarotase [Nitrosomonadales bacterium]
MIVAQINNEQASASIALQGAHLMTFQARDQQPLIWMSPAAKLVPGKSIRGGVPVCWPWFGAHASEAGFPAHGFARTVGWKVVDARPLVGGETFIAFELPQTAIPQAQWPHPCRVRLNITVGAVLEMALVTENTGDAAFPLGEALHTYFPISDVDNVCVSGLDGVAYRDKVTGMDLKQQSGDIGFPSEVDRVYLDTEASCDIVDTGANRRIRVAKSGSRSTVVWNPWIEKATKMGDFGSDTGYRTMLCVESANAAENVLTLAPGESHTLSVTYSNEAL